MDEMVFSHCSSADDNFNIHNRTYRITHYNLKQATSKGCLFLYILFNTTQSILSLTYRLIFRLTIEIRIVLGSCYQIIPSLFLGTESRKTHIIYLLPFCRKSVGIPRKILHFIRIIFFYAFEYIPKIPIAVFQDYNSVLIIRAVNNFYNCFVRKIKMLIVKHINYFRMRRQNIIYFFFSGEAFL